MTGHKDPTRVSEETRWSELGRAVDTLVILMGMRTLPELVGKIVAGGKDPATPAAAIMWGALPRQRVVEAPLAELPEHYRRAIWLIHIEGCSVRSAAESMGRTDRAIHGLCRRGLGLLQEKLGTLLEPPFSAG